MIQVYTLLAIYFLFFAIFHSLCSQEWFKNYLSKITGNFFIEYFYRFVYCLISIILLYEVFRPTLYQLSTYPIISITPEIEFSLKIINLIGIIITYWAFLQVDYFEFWGIKQLIIGIKKIMKKDFQIEPVKDVAGIERLEITGIYKFMRHPMLVGGLFMALAAPPSEGSLCYLGFYSLYMFAGGYYEEKRLRKNLGELYVKYSREVGSFYPKTLNFTKRTINHD